MFKFVKKDEIVIKQDDFGMLVEEFVRNELRPGRTIDSKWLYAHIKRWWPMVEEYYQRHIITAIEVALVLDDPQGRNRLYDRSVWEKIVKELRPARSAFTVKYVCSKCNQADVKLWRQYQTVKEQIELVCASCGRPDIKVDDEGRCENKTIGKTDQIGDWLVPAVPVGDTYWGYTSVPSQDLEWWRALPTYPKGKET